MTVRGIVFDLGFTLITIPNFHLREYNRLLKSGLLDLEDYLKKIELIDDSKLFYNTTRKIQKKNFRNYFSTDIEFTTEGILKESFQKLGIKHDEELIKKSAEIYHGHELNRWELRNGVISVLEKLSKQYKLAIISNAIYHEGIIQILKNLKIFQYFNLVLSSASVGLRKPNKGIFREALNKLNLPAKSCIFIGDDMYADICGAKRLHFITVHVKRGFQLPMPKNILVKPDHEINEIPEILDVLDKIN